MMFSPWNCCIHTSKCYVSYSFSLTLSDQLIGLKMKFLTLVYNALVYFNSQNTQTYVDIWQLLSPLTQNYSTPGKIKMSVYVTLSQIPNNNSKLFGEYFIEDEKWCCCGFRAIRTITCDPCFCAVVEPLDDGYGWSPTTSSWKTIVRGDLGQVH